MKHYTVFVFLLCLLVSLSLEAQSSRHKFRVQVAAFSTQIDWNYFKKAGLEEVYMQSDQNEIYRYYLGEYNTKKEAEQMKKMVVAKGFKFAQVIDLEKQRELCGTPCPFFTENTVYAKLSAEAPYLRVLFFDFNSAALKLKSMSNLEHIYHILNQNPSYNLKVIGHTDSKGDAVYNIELAKHRVRAARNYLVSKGIKINRFSHKSSGEGEPIAVNKYNGADSPEGRRYNRRVVVVVTNEHGELLQDLNMVSEMVPENLRVEPDDLPAKD